jgi:hypothetical protein
MMASAMSARMLSPRQTRPTVFFAATADIAQYAKNATQHAVVIQR